MTEKFDVNIFLLCYNEEILIRDAIKHYKKFIPNCIITIMDNKSTDNSVKIAKEEGCNIFSWVKQKKLMIMNIRI